MKRQPDGWCAWHPEKGYCFPSLGVQEASAMETLCFERGYYKDDEPLHSPLDPAEAIANGWGVRPVHIVDASPESKEVIVSKQWLEDLRLFLCEMQRVQGVRSPNLAERTDLMLFKVIDKVNKILHEANMGESKEES